MQILVRTSMLSLLLIVLCIQFMAISLETQPFVTVSREFTTTRRFYMNIISYTYADNLMPAGNSQLTLHHVFFILHYIFLYPLKSQRC